MHLRKHPEFAACISTEAQLAVFTAGPRDSKAQKLALHKVFESFMARSGVRNFKRPSIWGVAACGRGDSVSTRSRGSLGGRCRDSETRLSLGEK